MAFRKETIRKQANEMLAESLPPGETIVSGVYTNSGPSPWLMNELGLIGQFFVDYYYVAVTGQQVIFVRMNRVSNRPTRIEFALPVQSVRISDFKRKALWSSFRYQRPDQAKPRRLNVHRIWRDELDALVKAVGVPVA